jgi:hypothetical protein
MSLSPAASSAPSRAAALTPPVRVRALDARWVLRALLVGGAATAFAAAAVTGDPAAYVRADPGLATLLRGMAVIKALLATGAVGALLWRFGRPIERPVAVAYLAGAWCMAGASMLVWRLTHIGVGAFAFHAGELTLLLVAWREHRRETLGAVAR